MGCFQSKKDSGDIHPNVFRVVNIDEGGADLWSGQLEVTDSDLILYREGRDATVWPLRCLRRYGFDGEIFSFESGRRCATGEGIYAFRCRRAGMLFRTLQQNIQLRTLVNDSLPFQLPVNLLTGSPPSLPRQTLQGNMVHRSSLDNGLPDRVVNLQNNAGSTLSHSAISGPRLPATVSQTPRSPSSADILEVMPLYPRPQNSSNHVTNVYQMRDFKSREHNNNQPEVNQDTRHLYSNDISRDLAILRNSLRQEAALNTIRDIEDETNFLQSRYINEDILNVANPPLSPTLSNGSEHYARLNIEQENGRQYVNIVPAEHNVTDYSKNDIVPTTPLTPRLVDYSNINQNILKSEINSYANLAIGDAAESKCSAKQLFIQNGFFTEPVQKYSESDTYTSMSPVEELEVNYAVLDIDSNKETCKTRDLTSPESQSYASSRNDSTTSQCSSQTAARLLSQSSIEKTPLVTPTSAQPSGIGYTTIDFNKTVALTSVASGTDVDTEGCRKTRHNSTSVTCNSPGSTDKSKGN